MTSQVKLTTMEKIDKLLKSTELKEEDLQKIYEYAIRVYLRS